MNEVRIEGFNYYAIARRADRPWGHAIDVSVLNYENAALGNISFCCHPDFEDFALYQNYDTSELIKIASELLDRGMKDGRFKMAWESGLTLILKLNGSTPKLPDTTS